MDKRVAVVLLALVVAGFCIKFYPPLTNGSLVNFDSVYHARIGQIVADTGWVPSWDPAAGGRPHLYPPLYHLLLGYLSILSSVPVIELVKYILPAASVLLALTVYFLVKKYRGEGDALLAAAMTIFNPVIMAQSYDSPQIFGLLLFPLIVYFFLRGKHLEGGALCAVSLLFNYSIVILVFITLGIFSAINLMRKEQGRAMTLGLMAAVCLGLASPWLILSAERADCFNPSTAGAAITNSGQTQLLVIAPFVTALAFIALYSLKGRGKDGFNLLWRCGLAAGAAGFLLGIIFPQAHPYDSLLLFGFSLQFALLEMRLRRSTYIVILGCAALLTLMLAAYVSPMVGPDDLAAILWMKEHAPGASVLANTETSGMMNLLIGPDAVRTEFDLFLECIPDGTRWSAMYMVMTTSNATFAEKTLDMYGVDYLITGERDRRSYGFDTAKFGAMEGWQLAFRQGEAAVYARN